jgi:ABC-type branched-subunit amino acid transport system ATPase component
MSAPSGLLLAARGISKSFGGVSALRNVDLEVHGDQVLGIIGPNGSGKTSLINVMSGHLRPDLGTVEFCGHVTTTLKPHRLAQLGLSRTYQSVRVFGELTVERCLDTASLMREGSGATLPDRREILEWLELDRLTQQTASRLTLFAQRRLELAMRLMLAPKLLLLDEPVGGLSSQEVTRMTGLLQQLSARCGVLIIEHTMHVISALAERVVVLIAGEKVAEGPPAAILRDSRVVEEYLGAATHA